MKVYLGKFKVKKNGKNLQPDFSEALLGFGPTLICYNNALSDCIVVFRINEKEESVFLKALGDARLQNYDLYLSAYSGLSDCINEMQNPSPGVI